MLKLWVRSDMIKNYLGWTPSQWKRILIHIPIGIIAPLLGVVFGACFLVMFLAYQCIQEYQNKGKSHIDIAGAMVGLPIGCLILWLITLI